MKGKSQSVKEAVVSGIVIVQWTVTGVVMLNLCGTSQGTAGCSGRRAERSAWGDLLKSQDKCVLFSLNCSSWAGGNRLNTEDKFRKQQI